MADDDAFLDALYASTRESEVRGWGFTEPQAQQFLYQQAQLQRRAYGLQFPAAQHWLLLSADQCVGRLVLDPESVAVNTENVVVPGKARRIVDISVLGSERNQGHGTWLLTTLIEQAQQDQVKLSLRVARGNPAQRLYARLGFGVVAEEGEASLMLWWSTGTFSVGSR